MQKEQMKRVSAICLGCDKNRVDLEKILFSMKKEDFEIVSDPENADIVIVNTCAFILPAKQEAIENIIEMENLKRRGKIEKLVVTGCFPERNFDDLKQNFPDVDLFVRIKDNPKIPSLVKELYGEKIGIKDYSGRVLTTANYAFLKIADGCNNACAYCTIPRIRGRYHSAPMKELILEAKELVKDGVKEIILVAQDTTRYGEDLNEKNQLIELCKNLVKIKGLEWLRIHYLYPEKLTDELLDFIAKEPKICKYIDIPLQHIDDKILHNMRRRLGEKETRKLIEQIKVNYPEITLRTTFIVGFPQESIRQFRKLCKFIKETKFDCAGFFPFYREENTSAYYMSGQISNFIKNRRLKKIQKIQCDTSLENMKKRLNKKERVLVDDFDFETGYYIGHTQWLSPNTDYPIYVEGDVKVGEFIDVTLREFDGNKFLGGL